MAIIIKTPQEIEHMREAGKVVAATLEVLVKSVRPGMKTRELDAIAEYEIKRRNAKVSFKGYRGFPASICVSVNHQIVHGIPGDTVLQEGDLVKLDVGAIVKGFQSDAAVSVGVGRISPQAQQLLDATRVALEAGIRTARAGSHVGDVSTAIQCYVEPRGYSVVREYVGHGIGRSLHEDPAVPNYGSPRSGPLLRKGMAIAIEPMVNLGSWETEVLEDGWTVVTKDGSLSAHFEHTIAITDGEPEVLTKL